MERMEGRHRVVVESVTPEVDCGRFPVKRAVGEKVEVEADVFADGHDAVSAVLLYREAGETEWNESPMRPLVNDRWQGAFTVTKLGSYEYTVMGWGNRYRSWRTDVEKKVAAGQDISANLLAGAELMAAAAQRARRSDARRLERSAQSLRSNDTPLSDRVELALAADVLHLMEKYPDRRFATTYPRLLKVVVDREKAAFSAWYEMFPRSATTRPGKHGTFKDCEAMLPYVASMGFDVLYFPPIHPIAHTMRKGRNNAPVVKPGDPGSPWAIGSREGGHKAVHPELGTLQDFRELLEGAKGYGLEVAIDLAFQCSAEHPYVKEHPDWFRWRPDGTVQYAENPPKKYEDIYPLDFETENWRELWEELRSVVFFWLGQGVRIFRVDNPHTKPFGFWEWLISTVRDEYPDVVFLAEAFTRPKVMYRLAKLGFTQSYTYFTWRNTKSELTQYLTELTQTKVREYFRPNLWPNTPDILHEYLQRGGRPAFIARLVLAATLGSNYGIYGPAFELCENVPREPGSEEYLFSEKYEIKNWPLDRPDSLKGLISRVNQIRQETLALREQRSLRFHLLDNDQLIGYTKHTEDLSSVVLVVVNLDSKYKQSGWIELPIRELGLDLMTAYEMHDLLTGSRYRWQGAWNYVELDPSVLPAHIFRLAR
jgi:starch synthase (maltosyl-transferring)